MKLITWTVVAAIALAASFFAVSNRHGVAVELWPLPYTVELPAFLLVLGGLALGFVVGVLLGAMGKMKWRLRAETRTHDAYVAEKQAEELRGRIAELESQLKAGESSAVPAPRLEAPGGGRKALPSRTA